MKKNTSIIQKDKIIKALLLIIVVATLLITFDVFRTKSNSFALPYNIPAGSVVSVNLTTGDTYRFVSTGHSDGNYIYLVGLENACEIEEVGCVNRIGLPSLGRVELPSRPSTTFNASSTSYNNDLTVNENYSITTQTSNFFSILPADIKSVIRTTNWDMYSVDRNVGETTTRGGCGINDINCFISEPVFLVSYEEWQGGLLGYTEEPANGSVGDVWCKARYNADNCKDTEIYIDYEFPWLRTTESDSDTRVWSLRGMTGYSVNLDLAFGDGGVLPAMWANSSKLELAENVGDGSFDNPYELVVINDSNPDPDEPTISISVPSYLDINVTPTPAGKVVTGNIIASVSTDSEEGYTLNMHNPDIENVLRHWDDKGIISPINNITATPSELGVNEWGYNTINSQDRFLKTPIAPYAVNTSVDPVDSETTTITIGAKVDMQIVAGVYNATIIFTAVVNISP